MDDITDQAVKILCDLIALPTVNPMGRPYSGSMPIERPVVEYLQQLFAPYNVLLKRSACSDIHESLLVTIPGKSATPGTLFESHIDTVPADDWPTRAFVPRVEGSKITGRGACDDKASLTAMALAVLQLCESGARPPQTIWFLAAGDEEYGQTGIRQFIQEHKAPIGRAVFGEPTDCTTIVQHKGTIRWDLTVHGQSAHTSRPELGRSAILDAVRVINYFADHQHELAQRHSGQIGSNPTLTVTMIHGGRTRNTVPDECTLAVDFRISPGMDLKATADELFAALSRLTIPITHGDFQCFAPALNTSPNDPFVCESTKICSSILKREVKPGSVPYGSDAGWVSGMAPAIILGPGSINHAHAIDEFVHIDEVLACVEIYKRIMQTDWSSI